MTADDRRIPAPALRETADIWWDSGTDPVIAWDAAGKRWWLADGADHSARLVLLESAAAVPEPRRVAEAFRDGLAACDFPPTADGVTPSRAVATLRAAGLSSLITGLEI